MTEVTIDNFEDVLPKIEECFKNATFIAFDNEMSGLNSTKWSSYSLFDTAMERYTQIKSDIDPFVIMQTGLTTFRHVRDENKFIADSFNFYLMPRSIPTQNRHFTWQMGAIEFLVQNGFDFNKLTYRSLSYLNEEEEEELRKEVYNETFLQSIGGFIPLEINDYVQTMLNSVHEWLTENKKQTLELDAPSPLIEYLLHKKLRSFFDKTWTKVGFKKVTVIRVDPHEYTKFLNDDKECLIEDRMINYYIGFSKVFRLLIAAKKPVVGHNVFLDLMFMYKQFYKPLPSSYYKYKEEIHEIFPVIYDTKHISFNMSSIIRKDEKWKRNGLGEMYMYFLNEQGQFLAMNSPRIEKNQALQFLGSQLRVHDAGSDSYYAGYIFIKMAHLFAVKKFGSELKILTCTEIMSGVKSFINNVNIIRALISHVNFGGPDPVSNRPYWLYAHLLNDKIKDIYEITEMLSSFGNVDVKPISIRSALIAVGNHTSARDILSHFGTHKDISIELYNPLFHSNAAWYSLWAGIIIGGGLLGWVVYENISK